jgi:hypothetical protein
MPGITLEEFVDRISEDFVQQASAGPLNGTAFVQYDTMLSIVVIQVRPITGQRPGPLFRSLFRYCASHGASRLFSVACGDRSGGGDEGEVMLMCGAEAGRTVNRGWDVSTVAGRRQLTAFPDGVRWDSTFDDLDWHPERRPADPRHDLETVLNAWGTATIGEVHVIPKVSPRRN